MDLSGLLGLLESSESYRKLVDTLKKGENSEIEVLEAAKPFLIAALFQNLGVPVLVITPHPEQAKKLREQLTGWGPRGKIMLFPEPDILPYERLASDSNTETERIRVLASLAGYKNDGAQSGVPLVIVPVAAVTSLTTGYDDFVSAKLNLKLGTEYEPLKLLNELAKMGYRRENIVELPGAVSRRGGIVDVWPATTEAPVRLEYFGNTIDSLRLFDPETQRSKEVVESVEIGPATELLTLRRLNTDALESLLKGIDTKGCNPEVKQQIQRDISLMLERQYPREVQFYTSLFNHGSILDYLPEGALLLLDDVSQIEDVAENLHTEAGQLRTEKLGLGELPGNLPRPYFTPRELNDEIEWRQRLNIAAWGTKERLDFSAATGYAGKLPAFLKKVPELTGLKKRVIIVSHQASRLAELFDEENVIVTPVDEVTEMPGPGSLTLVHGSLPEGWVWQGDTCLFTDAEIFGFVKQRRLTEKRPVPRHKLNVDIAVDDYVVHVEHGIGKFQGVRMLQSAGTEKEYLVLQYAAGDTLYVPTDQIDRVNRYIGAGDRTPVLSRLGTQEWTRTKQRAKEAAEELAQELLALYAAREVVPGFAFSRDSLWQQEMESAFPYVETPDQLEALHEVKEDMERPRPMDRLVCGDVGYGKTEVAIRAAFKAIMDGRQVAVLVPTTVLAQQHYATFSERLEAFPVRVEVLSRFRSPGDQRAVAEGIALGTVDICIGTHRLLQKDIRFKDLGLLIIDEEQRFGVNHKEHFKKLRQEVDVLTLSATPIPRTLHLSLVGVRDMSTMETPPEERLPVKTYVAEYNERLVREAVLRELERNGQVFFVHNRVQSIAMITASLRELIPEAEIAIGHGQMPEEQLAKVMADFGKGKVDILVCTTIIESGLDMPNANTLIVNRADKFGLTQLYQLRGRVGRGANLAYAYFLYDGGKSLMPVARKRLQTIYEATELGAGFGIAMKDLEIRGAGSMLGTRQSGHITAVGFSLYTRLLAEAVEEQKAIRAGKAPPPPKLPMPAIDLPIDAFIPEEYVTDVETRLELYRMLADAGAGEKLDEVAREYADRFGQPPPEVQNLLYAVRIKGLAARVGIESVTTEEDFIVLRRFQGLPFDAGQFKPPIPDGVHIGRTQIRINYKKLKGEWQKVLEGLVKCDSLDLI